MRVEWTIKGGIHPFMPYSMRDKTHSGTIIGTIKRWWQLRLVILCDDGKVREVAPAKVEKYEGDKIDLVSPALDDMANKLTLIKKYFDMMATHAPKKEYYKPDFLPQNKADLQFDLPKKKVKKKAVRK